MPPKTRGTPANKEKGNPPAKKAKVAAKKQKIPAKSQDKNGRQTRGKGKAKVQLEVAMASIPDIDVPPSPNPTREEEEESETLPQDELAEALAQEAELTKQLETLEAKERVERLRQKIAGAGCDNPQPLQGGDLPQVQACGMGQPVAAGGHAYADTQRSAQGPGINTELYQLLQKQAQQQPTSAMDYKQYGVIHSPLAHIGSVAGERGEYRGESAAHECAANDRSWTYLRDRPHRDFPTGYQTLTEPR